MERRVKWSKKALFKAEKITYYLQEEWGNKVAEEFVDKLDVSADILRKYPFIGRSSEKRVGVRKILVTKHNVLIYKVRISEIYIADIFDTRQDPKKNKY